MDVPAHDEEGKQRRLASVRDIFATASNSPIEDDEAVMSTEKESSTKNILATGSILVDNCSGPVSQWPLYDDGDWWVQNPSATLPAIALRKGLLMRNRRIDDDGRNADDDLLKGLHVVDMCSAPGGKTAQLCSFGFGRVDAVEINERRSKILRQNLRRLGMEGRCNVVVADGTQWKPDATSSDDGYDESAGSDHFVDGIIVDAPCTATGNGSRRPEVLRKTINLPEQVSTQRELLAHAADKLLRPGGILVYATCSLLQLEGEDQVRWLISDKRREEHSDDRQESVATMQTVPFVPGEIPGFDDAIDENGWLRILPGTLPGPLRFCDGFFIARLVKV
jgi:16S rRNA (cytosine967-C5)-methyltransferase